MQTITNTQELDPTTLLVDVNVREDLRLDKDFVGSIKDHGVLVPIVAVQVAEGIRVRFGHRRTPAPRSKPDSPPCRSWSWTPSPTTPTATPRKSSGC